MVEIRVQDGPRRWLRESFLLDIGADRTVFSFDLSQRMTISAEQPHSPRGMGGIGGEAHYVHIRTQFRLLSVTLKPMTISGEFFAFTDSWAGNMSLLGRDVLDHFDVILARNHGEIALLTKRHRYRIEP